MKSEQKRRLAHRCHVESAGLSRDVLQSSAVQLGLLLWSLFTFSQLSATEVSDLTQNSDVDVGLKRIPLSILSEFERSAALYHLLADASAEKLVELFNQSLNGRPSIRQAGVHESIVRRLTLISPQKALNLIDEIPEDQQKLLIQAVFEEWSIFGLDEAIERGKNLDLPKSNQALKGILVARSDLSKEIRHAIARQFGDDSVLVDLEARRLIADTVENPKSVWNQLAPDYGISFRELSESQRDALAHVAGEWIKKDGFKAHQEVMKDIASKADRAWLVQVLLERFLEEDTTASVEYAKHIRTTDREVLLRAIGNWAAEDGWSAFQAAELVDRETRDDSLRLQRAAIIAWAEVDGHTLLASLPNLPSSLRDWGRETALLSMRYTSPESVPDFLEDIKDDRTRRMIVDNLVMDWARYDPHAALEWTTSGDKNLPAAEITQGYTGTIFYEAFRKDPHSAWEMALACPTDEDGVGPEAVVIGSTARWDIEKAIELLSSARNSATRRTALSSIATHLIEDGESDRALQMISDEPEEDHKKHYEAIVWNWAVKQTQDLLEKFDSVPFEEVKREGARLILVENYIDGPFMTKEDMEKIKEYVAEKDLELMQHTVD